MTQYVSNFTLSQPAINKLPSNTLQHLGLYMNNCLCSVISWKNIYSISKVIALHCYINQHNLQLSLNYVPGCSLFYGFQIPVQANTLRLATISKPNVDWCVYPDTSPANRLPWTLTHWGRGYLNCLNARSRGLNNLNQPLYCVSLKIYNKFVNYFCELKFSGNTHQRP